MRVLPFKKPMTLLKKNAKIVSDTALKILHTSDWHLGKLLYNMSLQDAFTEFLDWLLTVLKKESIDILIIAGDIFDTATPSSSAQNLYYSFLARVSETGCQHVVVIGGNHDSPNLLNAPKQLLSILNVHVVGHAHRDHPEQEIICLKNATGHLIAIICAVPFLRDRDIRILDDNESITDKMKSMVDGVRAHYKAICESAKTIAEQHFSETAQPVPIIATGHLFAHGVRLGEHALKEDQEVRQTTIGNLGGIEANIFPSFIDYVALGHIHVAQIVGKNPRIRYSGSPLCLNFSESTLDKQVNIISLTPLPQPVDNFEDKALDSPVDKSEDNQITTKNQSDKIDVSEKHPNYHVDIRAVKVPTFQILRQIKGDFPRVTQLLNTLITEHLTINHTDIRMKVGDNSFNQKIWLEILLTEKGSEDVVKAINDQLHDSPFLPLKIALPTPTISNLNHEYTHENLADLTPTLVFESLLKQKNAKEAIDQSTSEAIRRAYAALLIEIENRDPNAPQ